jgi:hypothetical protein
MRAYINTDIGDYKCQGLEGDIIGECGRDFYIFMPDVKTVYQKSHTFKGCVFLKQYFVVYE